MYRSSLVATVTQFLADVFVNLSQLMSVVKDVYAGALTVVTVGQRIQLSIDQFF